MAMRNVTAANGKSSRDARTKWLDKALEGRPPEIKARVLEIILKMGIDPENEFFVIFVALGQLQVLIEDSPNEWRHLFEKFQGELGEWATTNVETLAHLTHRAETVERLASISQRLGDTLNGLATVCKGLIEQLQASNLSLTKSIAQLSDSNSNYQNLLNQLLLEQMKQQGQLLALANRVEATHSLVNSLAIRVSQNNRPLNSLSHPQTLAEWREKIKTDLLTWKGSVFWLVVFYFFTSSLGFFYATMTYMQDRRLLLDTATRTQWLLEKANRRDCLDGIKKRNSPECQKYFPKNKR